MMGGILNKKKLILAFAALLLVLGAGIKPAMSYFTTYVTAKGSKTIQLGNKTEIDEPEKPVEWVKHVVVTNDGESEDPVYVRARAFAGSQYQLIYNPENSEKWLDRWGDNEPDGYYYYADILNPGESTSGENELLIKIENIPEDVEDFNVVVIYESTPVLYDTNGNPYADWTQKVVVNSEEGGLN